MGGFLSGLGELLGGFNAKRRIDTEGFDWREKQAQEEAARQRQREVWQQANEDRTLSQLGDVLAGQEDEPSAENVAAQMPGQVDAARRKWMAQVAMGRLPERKSAIEGAKAYTQHQRDLLRGAQRKEEIGLRGDEAEALTRVRAAIDAGEQPSPRDKYIANEASKRTGMTIEGMLKARTMGGAKQPRLFSVATVDDEGNPIQSFVTEDQARAIAGGQAPGLPKGPGATTQNRREAARTSIGVGEKLLGELGDPEFSAVVGPAMGRYKSVLAAAGAGDPYAQYLVGSLRSFAALQPQIHGFRAVRFAENIEKMLSTKQTPESLKAGIQGILTASYGVAGGKPSTGMGFGEEPMVMWQGKQMKLSQLPPEVQALYGQAMKEQGQ